MQKNQVFEKKIGLFTSILEAVVISFQLRPHLLKSNIYVDRKLKIKKKIEVKKTHILRKFKFFWEIFSKKFPQIKKQ